MFVIVLLALTFSASANSSLDDKIRLLEEEFQQLAFQFYQQPITTTKLDSISELETKASSLIKQSQHVSAIRLLYQHIDLIENNLEQASVSNLIPLLLKQNELNLAMRLLKKIEQESGDFEIARSRFEFAIHSAHLLDWERVHQILEIVPQELSIERAEYAHLVQGIALQKLKKHRQAEASYAKISASSSYFRHARLNHALAQIKQGWLTSGSKSINELLSTLEPEDHPEFINRLHLVLGYAQLQKDYYRNARTSFRNISLDSRYINRATLGIAMCVINMGEFENGLNVLSLLKARDSTDLSTEESYLLIPYVYEKLQQHVDVATSYAEAMTHYQNRINELKGLSIKIWGYNDVHFADDLSQLRIGNHDFALDKHIHRTLIINYRQLQRLLSSTDEGRLSAMLNKQQTEYDDAFQLLLTQLINQKIKYLNSYLSQAKFGLARLYDKSNQDGQQ